MAMPSSPRLPSPPPPAEIQIGPNSPSMGPNALQAQQIEQTQIDAAAKRRIHPGTKAADMAAGPPLIPLNELDSAFQLQEHLAALHYHHTTSNTLPITRQTAKLLATPPPGIDKTLWLYELCRFLIAQCNSLIIGFLFDTPPCSAATCPEMRASEWQFLCAVHDAPKSCCAIDYCCHTLDWAANVVTNPKIFPSRFVAPLADGHDKGAALKNLVNVFRRLHRIFAHAWFQHRGVFWSVEGQTGLYVFFKTVCDLYDLLPAENYKLPPEAEGLETGTGLEAGDKKQHQAVTAIARPPSAVERTASQDEESFANAAARTNTRRHIRSNPSTGNAIPMVPEVDEDDGHGPGLAGRMRLMKLSSATSQPPAAGSEKPTTEEEAEEDEAAEIPVIVMDEAKPSPARRETTVETRETTEDEKDAAEAETEPEKQEGKKPVQEENSSEAEPASVLVETELEKPLPVTTTEKADASPTEPEPELTESAKEEDESEDVGDETIIQDDDDEPEPIAAESKPEAEKAEEPPVSVIESKDVEEATAKEDPAAAAAVVAAATETEDIPEEKSTNDVEEKGHIDKPADEEAKTEANKGAKKEANTD